MATVKLSEALRKIDLLDGIEDGKYMGASIDNATTLVFKTCSVQECIEGAPDVKAQVLEVRPDNSLTAFDCKGLAERLNLLADVASKIKTTRFLIKIVQKELPKKDVTPSPEDMFVFRVVDFFISRILQSGESQKEPLSKSFARLPVDDFVHSIQNFGQNFGKLGDQETKETYERFKIDGNIAGAYAVFAAEATKNGFDPTPFQPSVEKPKK